MTHPFLAKVRAIRARAAAPPAAASVKRSRKGVRCVDLEVAVAAVCAEMAQCTARQTLEALYVLTCDSPRDDMVMLTDPAPVTCAQLDDALAEAQKFDLPASTLRPLTRLRALMQQAETQKAKEPVQYATVAQMKARDAALFDAIGWALGAVVTELNKGQPSASHLLDLLGRSANTDERRTVLDVAGAFDESKVPQRTQEEWLRYQARGHY